MNGNRSKSYVFLINGFLGHFLDDKIGVKNWQKSKANRLQKWPDFVNFIHIKKRLEIA